MIIVWYILYDTKLYILYLFTVSTRDYILIHLLHFNNFKDTQGPGSVQKIFV